MVVAPRGHFPWRFVVWEILEEGQSVLRGRRGVRKASEECLQVRQRIRSSSEGVGGWHLEGAPG